MNNFFLFLILVLHFISFGQTKSVFFYQFPDIKGLANNFTEQIYQDYCGYMWIANVDGLCRWDGKTLKHFKNNPKDSLSLPRGLCAAIEEDQQKKLWIGTESGLVIYNRIKNNFYRLNNDSLFKQCTYVIKADHHGNLWLWKWYGVIKLNPITGQYKVFPYQNKSGKKFTAYVPIALDKEDNVWVGFNDNLMVIDQKKSRSRLINLKNVIRSNIKTIFLDRLGSLWVSTYENGLWKSNNPSDYDNLQLQPVSIDNQTQKIIVNTFFQDSNNKLWLGSDKGLYYFNDNTFEKVCQTNLDSKPQLAGSISTILEDRSGYIWFGSHGMPIVYINYSKENFKRTLFVNQSLSPQKIISCFYWDKKDIVWIGTDHNGLFKYYIHNRKLKNFNIENGLLSDVILDIKPDNNGNLWMATWGNGLLRYTPSSNICKQFNERISGPAIFPGNNIKSIAVDNSTVWIGIHGEGLKCFDMVSEKVNPNVVWMIPNKPEFFRFINHIFKDSKARIWVSTEEGLCYINKNNCSDIKMEKLNINMCYEDQKGRIWAVGNTNTLFLFDEKTLQFRTIPIDDPFVTSIKSICSNHSDTLWFSSNNSIYSYSIITNAFARVYEADESSNNFFVYKAAVNLINNELLFGTTNGFISFYSTKINKQLIRSFFNFDNLYIMGQAASNKFDPSKANDTIILQSNQSIFNISYTAINLTNTGHLEYQYKLEGFDRSWIFNGTNNNVTFTNLNPGTYLLKIKYKQNNEQWIEANKVLTIIITPPFWKTWWFMSLSILLILFIIIYSIRYRINLIKKRNIELEKIVDERTQTIKISEQKLSEQNEMLVQMNTSLTSLNKTKDKLFSIISHDLKNQISSIISLSDSLVQYNSKYSNTERLSILQKLRTASSQFGDMLINLLSWSNSQTKGFDPKPEWLFANQIIEETLAPLQEAINQKSIQIQKQILVFSKVFTDKQFLQIIIRNLVVNAIKYSVKGGTITIIMDRKINQLVIRIADNGVGIDKERLSTLFNNDVNNSTRGTADEKGSGLGLQICKDLIEKYGGSIHVESEPNKETIFIIQTPDLQWNEDETSDLVNDSSLPTLQNIKNIITEQEQFETYEHLKEFKNKHILIIDDDPQLLESLTIFLSPIFKTSTADNGKTGLAEALQKLPDIIISDVMMPEMNGFEFCTNLKSDKNISHIPVILLTAEYTTESQVKGFDYGADHYLIKPVNNQLLLSIIINVIKKQEQIHQLVKTSITLQPIEITENPVDVKFMNDLIKYLDANLSTPSINADIISKHIGLSRTPLYNKIKSLTGLSVNDFVIQYKLKKSISYLIQTTYSISEVSDLCGFTSASYYTRCFTEHFKIPPTEYRKEKLNTIK